MWAVEKTSATHPAFPRCSVENAKARWCLMCKGSITLMSAVCCTRPWHRPVKIRAHEAKMMHVFYLLFCIFGPVHFLRLTKASW